MRSETEVSAKSVTPGEPPQKPPRLKATPNAVQQIDDEAIRPIEGGPAATSMTTTTNSIRNEKSFRSFRLYAKQRTKKKQLHFRSPLLTDRRTVHSLTQQRSDRGRTELNISLDDAETIRTPSQTAVSKSTVESAAVFPVAALTNRSEAAVPPPSSAATQASRLAHGCNGLMYACQHGDIAEVMAQLRSKPESLRQRDSSNRNVLHYCAAQQAQTRDLVAAASIAIAAPELLESADEDGFTPLHLAVIQGNLAMVNLLLANKADVNAVDKEGHSVVHWATVCGEVEALRSVLAAGGNVATPDINGGSPLHYAAQMCGASYEGKLGHTGSTKLALEILGILLAHPGSSVDVQDKDGRQPLLWAASAGSAKAVMALVKAGARVESADKDGLTALHCAASRGHTECIDTLISLCGAPTDLIDSNGCTALHYAVTLGHADATARLLDLEADPNRQDRKGRTPAHCGCSKGQFETVKLLKERGANLWLRNAKGDLPVHEAASSGRRDLVEWLLEQRPKQANTTSNDGHSLLHIAAANDFTDLCKLLLDYGADINAVYRNSKGVVGTPLDCSLQKGNRSTAKFLQSHGGLPSAKLRLAARRANPFHEAASDVVRPLKYAEKEELHDLRNSKKYVVYLKRSDSDGAAEENCSCTEQTYTREQRYAHTCRRHRQRHRSRKDQLRRRTSSCGEPKESPRGEDSGDILRSKSNIELRRRKSRGRYSTSSDEDDGDHGENDEDSCENCCYHKRQKQRVLRRRSTSSRRSKEKYDSDQDSVKRKIEKQPSPEKGDEANGANNAEQTTERTVEIVREGTQNAASRPESKTSNKSRPQSAKKRPTPPPSAGKEGTFIKSPPRSAKDERSLERNSNAVDLTDEEDQSGRAAELVTTKVDVHHGADETSLKMSDEIEETGDKNEALNDVEIEDSVNAIIEEVAKEVENVLQKATSAVEESKSGDKPQNVETEVITEKPSEESVVTAVEPSSQAGFPEEQPKDTTENSAEERTDGGAIQQADSTSAQEKQSLQPPQLIETPATPLSSPLPSPKSVDGTAQETTPVPSTAPETSTEAVKSINRDMTTEGSGKPSATPSATPSTPTIPPDPVEHTPASSDIATTPRTASAEKAPPNKEHTNPSGEASAPKESKPQLREQESRRSFTLLPSDSAEDEEPEEPVRKSSFQVLKSDESVVDNNETQPSEEVEFSDTQVFKIVSDTHPTKTHSDGEYSSAEEEQLNAEFDDDGNAGEPNQNGVTSASPTRVFRGIGSRQGVGAVNDGGPLSTGAIIGVYDYNNGRKRRLKKRVRSGTKSRSNWKGETGDITGAAVATQQSTKDQDSGFEPSPRATRSKIPTPRNLYTAQAPRRHTYAGTLDGRSCSSRLENRKPGDRGACDMSAVTRSIQRNIRRYYMERKLFQHLLELKSLQIRSNKLNEAVLVKRAVDDYHKSCAVLGGETGTRLRRYTFTEYTFKNYELFLYETLKALQKPGTYNFQNINEVYEEAERRLSPDYNAYEKALQCTTKTHRCLHAAHAYTGIPCAAYIPMMNHHTMPKFGFGPYKKTGVGSFYLPKILSSSAGGGSGGCGGAKVSLELSHGRSKQLISLPSDKLDSNKRYYVTFTVKESGAGGGGDPANKGTAAAAMTGTERQQQQQTGDCCGNETTIGK